MSALSELRAGRLLLLSVRGATQRTEAYPLRLRDVACAGRTVLRSYIVAAGGEFIVQEALTISSALARPKPGGRRRRSLLRETAQNMLRAVASCAGASAGAAAVVFLRLPDSKSTAQWPVHVGMTAGDLVASLLVSYLTDAWVAQGDGAQEV